jgi:hypothetical protein
MNADKFIITGKNTATYYQEIFEMGLGDDLIEAVSEERDNSELRRMYEQQLHELWIKPLGDGIVIDEDDGYCD